MHYGRMDSNSEDVVVPPPIYKMLRLALYRRTLENIRSKLYSKDSTHFIPAMPRSTDVVFPNTTQTTYTPAESTPPTPTQTYPTKLLVKMLDESPQGSYEYWLLESGKTLRIARPPCEPPKPTPKRLPTSLDELVRQYRQACQNPPPPPPFMRRDAYNYRCQYRSQLQQRPSPLPSPTTTRNSQEGGTRPPTKAQVKTTAKALAKAKRKAKGLARAKAKAKAKARKENRDKMMGIYKEKKPIMWKTRARAKALASTLGPIALLKRVRKSFERPVVPPPPISPCKSYCYPPLRAPSSPLNSAVAHLKFWKRKAVEPEPPRPGEMWTVERYELVDDQRRTPPGVELERRMWATEHLESDADAPRHCKWSSSFESLLGEDENELDDIFRIDVEGVSSTANQSTSRTSSSSESTAFSRYQFSPYYPSYSYSSPYTPRSPTTLYPNLPPNPSTPRPRPRPHPSIPSPATPPISPLPPYKPTPYRSLLPKEQSPADPTLHELSLAFHQIQKEKRKTPQVEYIACPAFDYQGDPHWDKNPLALLILYFSTAFSLPWTLLRVITLPKLLFRWIPLPFSFSFLSSLVGVFLDLIMNNGGATLLFLLSHVSFACAALLLLGVSCVVGWPLCVLHGWVVRVVRRIPGYRFKYSLGFPGFVDEVY